MIVNQNAQRRSASSRMINALSVHPNASTVTMNLIAVPNAKLICASMKRTTTAWQCARQTYRSTIKILKDVIVKKKKKFKPVEAAARVAKRIVRLA